MNWKSVSCAVQGRGHKRKNIPCQDKVARRVKNGVHVIALADGAGSASLSHFGAECVVNHIIKFVTEKFFDLIAESEGQKVTTEILSTILQALNEESQSLNCNLKDLASTLLVAAVSDENFFLAHLGDGVIGYLNDKGLKTVSIPDNGEFSNETVFLTSSNAASHFRIYKGALKNISGFILMSDGTEQSFYNKRTKKLAPVVKRLMHRTCLISDEVLTPQLENALNSVVIDNTQDDCSVAILARTSEQLPPLHKLPLNERQDIFNIIGSTMFIKVRQKIFQYDEICEILKKPSTIQQLSGKLHVKPFSIKKILQKLLSIGIIRHTGFGYEIYCR